MAAPPPPAGAPAAPANVLSTASAEFEEGKKRYCEDQWAAAAAAFTKSIELDNTKLLTYEYKVRAHMHQTRQEQLEFAGTGKGPDGVATGRLAYDTAWRAVQKFGNSRWESLAVLAEATCLIRQYGIVYYILQQVVEQPTYVMASLAQKAAIESHAKRHAGRGSRSCRHSSHRPLEVVDLPPPSPIVPDPARWNLQAETAFSPDLLLRVVDLAREDDPNVAVRLSGVCRPWRSILVNQPGCWQKLLLGPGDHMVDKARAYLARCGGGEAELKRGLKELRIAEGFDSGAVEELGELLAPHAPFIQSLQLDIRPGDARILYAHLYHGLSSVRSLDIANGCTTSLDFGLLPPKKCMLKTLAVSKIMHDNPRDRIDGVAESASELTTWLDNPVSQLAKLEVLRMTDSYLVSPISGLYALFQHTPKLREVYLDNLAWWKPPGSALLPPSNRGASGYHPARAPRAVVGRRGPGELSANRLQPLPNYLRAESGTPRDSWDLGTNRDVSICGAGRGTPFPAVIDHWPHDPP